MILDSTSGSSGGEQLWRTPNGALLIDPSEAASLLESAGESIFDPGYWQAQQRSRPAAQGRGSAWFIRTDAGEWVLRHFSRGGLIAKFLADRYCWSGENQVRAFSEWRLTAMLHSRGLPVPRPLAARYRRRGLAYRCDLITQRIAGAESLSAKLAQAPLKQEAWREIGAVIARFHRAGVDHADLNAHNILLDSAGRVSLIDFDRGRIRSRGRWMQRNLARLHRSLEKISRVLPGARFDAPAWRWLLSGYEAG